jgi:ABC-type sugar transport system permease subunit
MTFTREFIFRLVALAIIDAFGLELAIGLGTQYSVLLGLGIFVITLIINVVFLTNRFYAWRWTVPGLALMALMVLYPLISTVLVAFTNYSDGHSLTKDQALGEFLTQYYKPADALTFKWTAYLSSSAGQTTTPADFVFWLVDPNGKAFVGSVDKGVKDASTPEAESVFGKFGDKDSSGVPASIGSFNRLSRLQVVSKLKTLQDVSIKDQNYQIRIASLDAAPAQVPKYTYDAQAQTLTDHETSKVYHEVRGEFVTGEGTSREALTPGWYVPIGADNFLRVVTDPNISEPFFRVFAWTIIFAVASVLTTFSLGLGFALVLNVTDLPMRPFFRTILILPYALPGFISVLVWVGLFNPIYGPINNTLSSVLHISPGWFSDPTLAKIAILLINLWLGYPYMMLITMGALQSIPADIYEAAVIDGAAPSQQFWAITLPLLLVAVGPLLIGSFAFNFNNFAIIELFNKGGPPASALTPAGHTDILISYTYRLAFGGTKGADYGFASAITLFIFVIVAGITIVNFRLSRSLEQVSENV